MTAQRGFALAVLVVALLPLRAAPVPDVGALISCEARQVTANGATRFERWQERLIRRADTVWTERVPPASADALHAGATIAEHTGHKQFDFDRTARVVQREFEGQPRLRFVDCAHRVVVSVPKAEYGAVGFDGSWNVAAHFVPPSTIARMKPAGDDWRSESARVEPPRALVRDLSDASAAGIAE